MNWLYQEGYLRAYGSFGDALIDYLRSGGQAADLMDSTIPNPLLLQMMGTEDADTWLQTYYSYRESRRWFTRIWTVQEVVLSKPDTVTVMVG